MKKPKWHYLYYLLATFDLLTVSASLYLNYQVTGIYSQSVSINQEWTTRLHQYSKLGQLAAAVNSPGNDVFDSHDVPTESKRLNIALDQFKQQITSIRQDLRIGVPKEQAALLLKDLEALDRAMAAMTDEANHIFSYIRQNQPELAGRQMATMDRKYHKVNQVLDSLRSNVSKIQQQTFEQQKQETNALRKNEYVIASAILAMVLSVTMYGHKLAQEVQISVQEKEQSIQKLQQAEAFLKEQALELEHSFHELQRMQAKLVEAEKMSALGVLVAGVAHEINNPVNFIHGNLKHAEEYSSELLDLLTLYQNTYPTPPLSIQAKIDAVDLDFLRRDLPQLLGSMQVGTVRIREIVKSLRNFSRLDESEFKAVDIHEGLDSTLMILQRRLKTTPERPNIVVNKEYSSLPNIECYPGQLNQVFINLLINAIDALEEEFSQLGSDTTLALSKTVPTIHIRTEVLPNDHIAIRVMDNGPGIPKQFRHKLFDPFFTTKSVGKGTGLGLSISYQIIVEKHHGTLRYHSELGQGTEFVIEIPISQTRPSASKHL